jgi:excisionase family DNA binding protein
MSEMHESPASNSRQIASKPDEKLLVSRREAAARLSISQRELDYLIANRTLTAKRIGSRVLIPEQDLRRFARGDHPERLAS